MHVHIYIDFDVDVDIDMYTLCLGEAKLKQICAVFPATRWVALDGDEDDDADENEREMK